ALGQLLSRRNDYRGAIAAYEGSLKWALSGRRAISDDGSLSMLDDGRTPWDNDHGVIHAKLAQLHAATGEWNKAVAGYRIAIAMGIDIAAAWFGLARAYTRGGQPRDAVVALLQACARAPRDSWRWGKRRWLRWCRAMGGRLKGENVAEKPADEGRPRMWV